MSTNALTTDVTTQIDVSELIFVEPAQPPAQTIPIECSQILLSQPLPVTVIAPRRGWFARLWDSLTRRRVSV